MSSARHIQLDAISKSWQTTRAVNEVSFAVAPGEFVILLGPSGCGKSTTLRMIAGLEQASSGRIHIGGRDVTALPPGDRGISMVFQSYALFPHLSVAENIVFGLRSRRVPKAERQQRLAHVAHLVGLEEYLERKPAQLSGGQRQRVALARAVISEHSICLMDEPLSNLDARLRGEMRREIKSLQQRLGMTVIYVTHDQVEAMSMGDRVILMRQGRIEQDGTPSELYNRPASAFAASFIGSPAMNLLTLANGPDGAVIAGEPRCAVAPAQAASGQLGIRPEDIQVLPGEAEGVPAEAIDAEYLGADTLLRLKVGSQTLLARQPGQIPWRGPHPCRLRWSPDAAHLFTAGSGTRRDDLEAFASSAATGHHYSQCQADVPARHALPHVSSGVNQ